MVYELNIRGWYVPRFFPWCIFCSIVYETLSSWSTLNFWFCVTFAQDTSQGWLSWIFNLIVIFLVYVCTFITFPITGWFVLKVRWWNCRHLQLLQSVAHNKDPHFWFVSYLDSTKLPEDRSFPSWSNLSSKGAWCCPRVATHWPVAESRPAHSCFQHPSLPGKPADVAQLSSCMNCWNP